MCTECLNFIERKEVYSKINTYNDLKNTIIFPYYASYWYGVLNNFKMLEEIYMYAPFANCKYIIDRAFYGACHGGHYELVRYLIENNYAINIKEGLFYACISGDVKIINMLIENGADDWNIGLLGASVGKHKEIVKMMLKKNACFINVHYCKHDCAWNKYPLIIHNWLLSNGVTRDQIKYSVKDDCIGLNRIFNRLDKKNNRIKKEIDGLLIKDVENIIIDYSCL